MVLITNLNIKIYLTASTVFLNILTFQVIFAIRATKPKINKMKITINAKLSTLSKNESLKSSP